MIRRKTLDTIKERMITALLILVLIWLIFQVYNIARKEEIARQAAHDAKRELELLEERKETLEENLAELETDRGQEATLRETYGVARPGEEVIIVVPDAGNEEKEGLPWWRQVFSWFGL
jgi:cell division protein FtsB